MRVTDFPHVQQMFTDAYARLVAMKLFALRAVDYMRSASPEDRRYLLYNPIVKMKVTTQGEEVIDLLWDVIAAKGFEKDMYFEMAARDIRGLPKLEGTVHVNIALIAEVQPETSRTLVRRHREHFLILLFGGGEVDSFDFLVPEVCVIDAVALVLCGAEGDVLAVEGFGDFDGLPGQAGLALLLDAAHFVPFAVEPRFGRVAPMAAGGAVALGGDGVADGLVRALAHQRCRATRRERLGTRQGPRTSSAWPRP